MKLEFRLLGDIAVVADGRPLDLGGTRQRSVLALLLLNRNRSLATELLADRLWPDEQPLSAIKTIQVYVSRIRHALGSHADRLASSPTGYRLAVADDELDAARFERGLRQAREALASGSVDDAATRLERSLALWSGHALGDLATERFARREADRLEELRVQALEELFELQVNAGSGRETIAELRRLLADQPGRERLWRLLMLALYADGRQGEALAAYHEARAYLADELGLDPSPELAELERAILTQEAPRPVPHRPAPVASLDEAIQAPTSPEEEGEAPPRRRRIVTIVRADIGGGTHSDALDPEILDLRGRRLLDIARRAVERHGGTIDHADHGGVTAVFGLTASREDDALRAVRAAFELSGDPSSRDASDGEAPHVGVATGEVLAGSKDAHGSMLTGAPLQIATRLAARAGPHETLLAGTTEQLARGALTTEGLSVEPGDGDDASSAFRLLSLTDGEAIIRRTTTPFVGRAAELHALVDAFQRVVSRGAPGLVTVIGTPGVGKSRLVAEAFARISKRALILRARCLPYGEGITYWPVRDLVFAALGMESGNPRADILGKLRVVLGGLDRADIASSRIASIVGLADVPTPAEEIPWAVRRFFETLAAERPLVLLIDDLQWAEPVLVDLLEHVLDLGRGPILLVTIARPELEETRPAWLARSNQLLIRLDSLTDADAATLLDRLAPDLHPRPLRARILAAAEGNPLFVEQFVAYGADAGEPDADHPGATTEPDVLIPPTIGALLAARLDRLPETERRILERAAVVGRTFPGRALHELLPDAERAALPDRLARLARRDLIRPERSESSDEEAYRFRHLLIRDAAYASLPKRERADLHERFADWLERHSASNPGELDLIVAYHLEQTYRYRHELGDDDADSRLLADRALLIIAAAGQAAEERGDPHAAISLLRRALDLGPPPLQRIQILITLQAALQLAGDMEASRLADAEAVALLAEYPDEGLAHRRWLSQAMYGLARGSPVPGAEAAYAYYESVGDGTGMLNALEVVVMHPERVKDAAVRLDQAVALAISIGRPDRAATLAARTSWIFPWSPVPVADCLARLRRYLDWAGSNRFARAVILMHLGEVEAMSGIRDRWRRHFEEAKAIIDDLGLVFPFGVFGYPAFLSVTELEAGDPARVVDMLLESCSTLDRLGDFDRLASLAPDTAQVLLAIGRLDEVEQYAFWGRDIAAADDVDAQARWRIAVSGLRSLQGRHEEAIALARESIGILLDSDFVVLLAQANMTLAKALRAAGDEPAAGDAATEALRLATAKGNVAAVRKIEAFLGNSRRRREGARSR